jgi:hypothetical protein
MKNFKHITFILFALAAFTLGSCKKDKTTPPVVTDPFENLTYIGETQAVGAGAIVKIYAEEALFVGYNRIYVALYDSANPQTQLTDAHVTFKPMMDMGMMQHSCPFENPSATVETKTKAFKGAVVFVMPTTATGSWMLNVNIHNHSNNQEGVASLAINVVQKTEPKLISFVSDNDNTNLFVTLIEPTNPTVGINSITFGIYKRESMMNFPPVDGYVIEMEPEMPSMGHGSPNNVNPVSKGSGMYTGAVNFTMTGYWKINLDFKTTSGDTIKLDQYFDITFQ